MSAAMSGYDLPRDEARQVKALLAARALLYGLFRVAFGGRLDGRLLALLGNPLIGGAAKQYAEADVSMGDLSELLERLRKSAAGSPDLAGEGVGASCPAAGDPGFAERAADEHTRIFIGPGNLPASPYESPYTGSHDLALFQENTLAVRQAYHRCGLRLRREQAIPDDHIAALMGFMAVRSRGMLESFPSMDARACAEELRDQADFAARHLANWLGEYSRFVSSSREGADPVLYPQLLEGAAAFVRIDCVFLHEAARWLQERCAGPGADLGAEACAEPGVATGPAVGAEPGPKGAKRSAAQDDPEVAEVVGVLDMLEGLRLFGSEDTELIALGVQEKVGSR